MTDRITQSMLSTTVLADLQTITDKLANTQNKLSSGKEIQKPSDDPFATARALQFRAELASNKQYQSNVGEASSWQSTRTPRRLDRRPRPARARPRGARRERHARSVGSRIDRGRDRPDRRVDQGGGEHAIRGPLHLLRFADDDGAVYARRTGRVPRQQRDDLSRDRPRCPGAVERRRCERDRRRSDTGQPARDAEDDLRRSDVEQRRRASDDRSRCDRRCE